MTDKKNQEMVDCINRALDFKNHGEQYLGTPIPFCSLHTKISDNNVKTYELHFSGLTDWNYEMNIHLERMDYEYVMNTLKINLVMFMEKWAKHLIKTELKEN